MRRPFSGHQILRWLLVVPFISVTELPSTGWAQEFQPTQHDGVRLQFFPRERLFPKLLADGSAQQFSLNKDAHTRRWIGSIGGLQRILQFKSGGLTFQFGVGATVYASLVRQPNVLQVVTVDFFVDLPVDIQFSKVLVIRTGWGHYSAHLADDGIEIVGLSSLNYAKDYIPLFISYMLEKISGFVYGGGHLDYFSIPERRKHWLVQFGAEGGNVNVFPGVRLFGAVDIKLRSEVAWATTQSYQIGVKMLEHGSTGIRVAYTFRTGIDDRGQFYKQRTSLSLLGLYLDF